MKFPAIDRSGRAVAANSVWSRTGRDTCREGCTIPCHRGRNLEDPLVWSTIDGGVRVVPYAWTCDEEMEYGSVFGFDEGRFIHDRAGTNQRLNHIRAYLAVDIDDIPPFSQSGVVIICGNIEEYTGKKSGWGAISPAA